jgi:rhamnulokinase
MTRTTTHRVAVDLGAGSGRALLGRVEGEALLLEEVHRFHYGPMRHDGHLRWDMASLLEGLTMGLRHAQTAAEGHGGSLRSIGVDSWAVDYGLVDDGGRLLEDPIAYRDERTDGIMAEVFERVPRHEIFTRTGIQFLQLNTLYQLFAHVKGGLPNRAHRLLMIPDLCHHHLCGSTRSEATNASTTQMWNAEAGRWDEELLDRLGLPVHLLPDVVPAGTVLGSLLPERRAEARIGEVVVLAPATHDTASAVAGTPLEDGWAYLSSGTWSLLGVERGEPVLSEDAGLANFTNEGGVDGTVRFLKNVMGLWILESCRKEWRAAGRPSDLESLLTEVASTSRSQGVVFPDDPRFFNPPSMVRELQSSLAETGQPPAEEPAALARVVLDSLALRYASVLDTIERLTGRSVPGVHVVGGGSLNEYLNQATADVSERPVRAGPAEATAAGNLVVQAMADGEIPSLAEGRRLLGRDARLRRYEPRRSREWSGAKRLYREIEARALST